MVTRRRLSNKSLEEQGDLLAILLSDDLFKDNDKLIIDECLTFFFAGTQTSSIASQNMLMYMI